MPQCWFSVKWRNIPLQQQAGQERGRSRGARFVAVTRLGETRCTDGGNRGRSRTHRQASEQVRMVHPQARMLAVRAFGLAAFKGARGSLCVLSIVWRLGICPGDRASAQIYRSRCRCSSLQERKKLKERHTAGWSPGGVGSFTLSSPICLRRPGLSSSLTARGLLRGHDTVEPVYGFLRLRHRRFSGEGLNHCATEGSELSVLGYLPGGGVFAVHGRCVPSWWTLFEAVGDLGHLNEPLTAQAEPTNEV
mmetsp:Transcript_14592/g.43146  ORF Transcript_14592/g.43146 Transcript_14592/m.43146 type:complete len:249 (-) Transcript_14592:910-1656(-)